MVGALRAVRQLLHLWLIGLKVRGFGGVDALLGALTPLLLYVLLAKRAPVDETPRVFLGMVVLSALVMMRKLGLDLVSDRVFGQLALIEAMGVTRGRYLAAQLLTGISYGVVPGVVLAVGMALGIVNLPSSSRWVAVLLVVVSSTASLGLLLGACLRSLPAAHLVLNLAAILSMALAPVAYPPERVSGWLLPIVELIPATLGAEALVAAFSRDVFEGFPLALLVAWTLVAMGGAGFGLRRQTA